MPPLRVAAIHFGKSSDMAANADRLIDLNRRAAAGGAKFIVNPELPTIQLFTSSAPIRCPDVDETVSAAECIAARTRAIQLANQECAQLVTRLHQQVAASLQVHVVVAVFHQPEANGDVYNSAFVLAPHGVVGRFDKRVLTAEKHYICVGATPFTPAPVGERAVGAAVCGDYSQSNVSRPNASEPNATASVLDRLAGNGCDLIAIPAALNSPTARYTSPLAAQNQISIIMANCFEGSDEGGIDGRGSSLDAKCPPETSIVGSDGAILASFQECRDEIVFADLPGLNR